MWCRPNGLFTKGKRESKDTSCIMGLLYEQCPWLRLRRVVLVKSPITFTLLHCGLEIFPMLPILSLHPYGKAVPSFLIQYSSRCLRKGVLNVGLLAWWYIFFYDSHFHRYDGMVWGIKMFLDVTEQQGIRWNHLMLFYFIFNNSKKALTYKKTNNKLEKKYNFTLWITQIVDKLPKIQHTFVMEKEYVR